MRNPFLLAIILILAATNLHGQTLAVDKTDVFSDDRLILCGEGKPLDVEAVQGYIRKGLAVVSLGYTESGWTIAMAKGTGYTDQVLHSAATYPRQWIEQSITKGYRITTIAYGNGYWWVVMSKGSPYGMQHIIGTTWSTATEKIRQFMNNGEFITACTYSNGRWTVVMSPCSIYTKQVFFTCRNMDQLQSETKKYFRQGYTITNLSVGSGEVLCVMSAIKEDTRWAPEDRALITPRNFRIELREFWDQGYHIVNVCNGSLQAFSQQ